MYPNIVWVAFVTVFLRWFEYGLNKPTREIVFSKLARNDRFKSTVLVDTFMVRIGDFSGSGFIALNKFLGVDPILGPEMKSTGEVMGVGSSFSEAYAKAQLGAGEIIPQSGSVFLSVRDSDRPYIANLAKEFIDLGFKIIATQGTARHIEKAGFPVEVIKKVAEGRPHVVDAMKNGDVNLIVNTTEGRQSILDSASIRRTALEEKIYCTTTLEGGRAVCSVLRNKELWSVERLQDLHDKIQP